MAEFDILRFLIGLVMLSYGSWLDFKTRRVPNYVWIYGGIFGSLLLIYDISKIWEDYGFYLWALLFATLTLFFNSFVDCLPQYQSSLSFLHVCFVSGGIRPQLELVVLMDRFGHEHIAIVHQISRVSDLELIFDLISI